MQNRIGYLDGNIDQLKKEYNRLGKIDYFVIPLFVLWCVLFMTMMPFENTFQGHKIYNAQNHTIIEEVFIVEQHTIIETVWGNETVRENCTKTSIEYNTVESPTYIDLWGPINTDGVGNAPPGVISEDSEIHFIETCNVDYECNAQARSMMCGRSSRCFQEPVVQNGTDSNSTSCACMTGYQHDQATGDCVDIDECESGVHKCVDNICYNLEGSYRCKTIVDVVWAIDGTGSYKTHRSQAKENFKNQLEYFQPHINDGLDFRMGLTFWTDRWFTENEMTVGRGGWDGAIQYKCGLPLTNISELTDTMIDTAFEEIIKMDFGDDAPEDLLTGIVFSRTDPDVDWLDESIKQMHIFTDNPFHYYGDGTLYSSHGEHTPPLEKWSTQPEGLYRYCEPNTVSAFTRGCEWDSTAMQCGGQYRSDWVLNQIFFNLVNCNDDCHEVYNVTFDSVPTALADWTPEAGLLGTKFSRPLISSDSIHDSFSKLTEELDEVMEDTLEIVEFNACNVKGTNCEVRAECIQTINGYRCECSDLRMARGLNCTCS